MLTSFRPGGFEARYLDESIPLKHGVIGQETQGPGGFFMALRSIHVIKGIIEDMEAVCPGRAALQLHQSGQHRLRGGDTSHGDTDGLALRGPDRFQPLAMLRSSDSIPTRLDAVSIGLNHGSWSVRHLYDGQDVMPLLREGYERLREDPNVDRRGTTAARAGLPHGFAAQLVLPVLLLSKMRYWPSCRAKPTTRAQDIMASVPDYWAHYREQAARDEPQARSSPLARRHQRAGAGDRRDGRDLQRPQGALVRQCAQSRLHRRSSRRHGRRNGRAMSTATASPPLAMGHLPRHVVGLVKMLGEYQALTAEAAWSGTRLDAVRALASHPLVLSLHKAETHL